MEVGFSLGLYGSALDRSLFLSKTVVEKFTFNQLIIEKVNFFTQSSRKIFCSSIFNVGSCLASC